MKNLQTKFVITPDNFHPCFENNEVEVNLFKIGRNNYGLSIWGDDDYGFEIDELSLTDSYLIYFKIQDGITIKKIKELGFEQA